MKTFCTLCKTEIPAKRQARKARTCSSACQKGYRKLYNEELAKRRCKYCGRRKNRRSSLGVVLHT